MWTNSMDRRLSLLAATKAATFSMPTGSPPFTGQNHFQLLYKHGNEAPDPPSQRSKKANIPAHVEAAVLRAMEKDPADRFDTMDAFCDALRGPTVPRRARTFGLPLLGAALVAGVAFLLWPTRAPVDVAEPAAALFATVAAPGSVRLPRCDNDIGNPGRSETAKSRL